MVSLIFKKEEEKKDPLLLAPNTQRGVGVYKTLESLGRGGKEDREGELQNIAQQLHT